MAFRIIMMLALLVSVSACGTKKGTEATDISTEGQSTSTSGLYGDNGYSQSNVTPGSAEDFLQTAGDRVFFAYDSFDLSAEAQDTLNRQAEWLKQYSNVSVIVEGHCDERGTREYNLALGEKRANSVKNYLAALGVDSSRVQTISYGKERPAVMGSDETSWAQNRRGVTVIE